MRRQVPPAELPFEYMLNALRLTEGWRPADFERTTGLAARDLGPTLAALEARGLLGTDRDRLRPTALGFRFLNDLQSAFLPETADVAFGSRTPARR